MMDTIMHFYLPQDHVLQQTVPVVVDMVEVVTVICYVTYQQIETAVLILPRPANHVSANCQGYECTSPIWFL